ncbi:hypothetical protein [Thomasclavelia saccharogumia]|uniref:hypothetical protein n=1 Tax=Thomasclavelia saccharogumia TaxID=341225 RepID=UPI00047D3879|nr:hypothetical protein [Thomasclavelia saccharogumia]
MNDNFIRTGFMEGVGYIFSNFFEYFKLFLFTIINGLIILISSKIPYFGELIVVILNILTLAFIPYGITLIVCDIKIDFSIYQKYINFLSVGIKKEVLMQFLKLILILGSMIIIVAVIVGVIFNQRASLIETISLIFSILVLLIVLMAFMTIKIITTLYLKLICSIYEDDNLEFYQNNLKKYRYIFLWNFVPIINIVSLYVICTIFSKDIKKYFDL